MKPYYEDGLVTIYHADCRDVFPLLSADAMVTDPPYGIGWTRGTWSDDPDEYHELMKWLVATAGERVSGWCFVFQAMLNAGRFHQWFPEGWRIFAACKNFAQVRPTGVWHSWDPVIFWSNTPNLKATTPPDTEFVNRDFHVGNVAGIFADKTEHPCRRPLDTMKHIVAISTPTAGLVVDPFCGSGTTLRAAKDQGIRSIGIEINERYCEIAAKRMAQGSLSEMFASSSPAQEK